MQMKKNRVWIFSEKSLGRVHVKNTYSCFGTTKTISSPKKNVNLIGCCPKFVPDAAMYQRKKIHILKLLQFALLTFQEKIFYETELAKLLSTKKKQKKNDSLTLDRMS